MALWDLEHGQVDVAHELTGATDLVGLPEEDYAEIKRLFPAFVRTVLPTEFAEGFSAYIRQEYETQRAEDAAAAGELIAEPVTTATGAYEQIVQSARQAVLALDWEGEFGVSVDDEETASTIELMTLDSLRHDVVISPITLLRSGKYALEFEQEILDEAPNNEKYEVVKDYWLVLEEPTIHPELATALRYYLFLRGIESVAQLRGLDELDVHLRLSNNPQVTRATEILTEYLAAHPERLDA